MLPFWQTELFPEIETEGSGTMVVTLGEVVKVEPQPSVTTQLKL